MASAAELHAAYARHGPALRRKCERLLGSQAEAEDVVQGLFLDLLQRQEDAMPGSTGATTGQGRHGAGAAGQGPSSLPYLYQAVTHRCLNLLRDARRRRELLATYDEGLRGPVRTQLDEQVISLELLGRLAARLDERSLELLVYRCFDDLAGDEIALLLGISRRAVVKRLTALRRTIAGLAAEEAGA